MKFLINFLILVIAFHCLRDLMQLLGISCFITKIGHNFGIKWSDKFWNLWGLHYGLWSEYLAVAIEVVLLFFLLNRRKIYS